MATQKMRDADILAEIADQLGITSAELNSMDVSEIEELMASGDLDPAQKAKLVRTKLRQLKDVVGLAEKCLEESSKESKSSKEEDGDDDVESPFAKSKGKRAA